MSASLIKVETADKLGGSAHEIDSVVCETFDSFVETFGSLVETLESPVYAFHIPFEFESFESSGGTFETYVETCESSVYTFTGTSLRR